VVGSEGLEIDLLLLKDRLAYPVEIKKSASPRGEWARLFSSPDRLKLKWPEACVACLCRELLPLTGNVSAFPVGLL